MELRALGQTGLSVTTIGLGSQTVGGLGYGDQDQSQSQEIVETYLRGGGRFIDSARGYGTSEIHVGKAIKASGLNDDDVIVCSKTGSNHPPCAAADLDVSRFCLQRDWIDVYYLHVPPADADALDRMLDTMAEFKSRGYIRHIGLSCRVFSQAGHWDEVAGWCTDSRVEVIQFPYNFSVPDIGELIDLAYQHGTGAVCRSTVLAGLLSEDFRPGSVFTNTANDWKAGRDPEAMQAALQIADDIRQQYVKPPLTSLAQLSQAWVLQHPGVSCFIAGGGSVSEVEAMLALASMDIDMSESDHVSDMAQPIHGLIGK